MKNIIKSILLIGIVGFISCEQNDEITLKEEKSQGKVSFSFEVTENGASSSSRIANTDTPSTIVVSIESSNGDTVYNNRELNVIGFNGNYISEPVSLEVGDYELTDYFVLNDQGSAIYMTPKEDSPLAYLVEDPLSIDFSIMKDASDQLVPEVLSTEGVLASDFGYTDFSFDVVETFDFLISVHFFDTVSASYELTSANVSILANGIEVYNDSIVDETDQIRVPDGYASYEVIVSKAGFVTNAQTVDNATLKSYLSDPLLVALVRVPEPVITTVDVFANNNGVIRENGVSIGTLNPSESFHITVDETDTWFYAQGSNFSTNANGDSTAQAFVLSSVELPNLIDSTEFNVSALVGSINGGESYFLVGTDLTFENTTDSLIEIELFHWDTTPDDNSGFVSVSVERN